MIPFAKALEIACERNRARIVDDLTSGKPDAANAEALWSEVEKALPTAMHFASFVSIGTLVTRTASRLTDAAEVAGLLHEKAMRIASGEE